MLAFFISQTMRRRGCASSIIGFMANINSWMGKPSKRALLKTGRFLALTEVRSSSGRLMERDQRECDSRNLFVLRQRLLKQRVFCPQNRHLYGASWFI